MIRIYSPSYRVTGGIEDNVFLNNSRVTNIAMNTIDITRGFGVSLANNVFNNPEASHEILAPRYSDNEWINATYCYWGVTSYADVILR